MDKIDFTNALSELYHPSAGQVSAVDGPPRAFLMIDGRGDPHTAQSYADAVEALY